MNWKVKGDHIGLSLGKQGAITVMAGDFNEEHLAILKARAKNRCLDEADYLMKAGLVPDTTQRPLFEEEKPKKKIKSK